MSDSALPADSLHALYRDHRGWLHGWLSRKLGCSENAADLTQDTFVRVLRQQHQLESLREPRAYLSTIARNLLINHIQRRSLEQAYLDVLAALPDEQTLSAEHRLILLETLLEVDAVLGTLPLQVREAFLLSQLEEMSQAEIAQRLGITTRTVRRYIVRGFEQCILLTP